jgi:large subunit ribosomal protein L29
MKASALRDKSATELQEELLSLRREQFALRLQRATGQMPKPDQFGKVRKNIARVLTVQRQVRAAGVGAGFAVAAARVANEDSALESRTAAADEAKPKRTRTRGKTARSTATATRASKTKAGKA